MFKRINFAAFETAFNHTFGQDPDDFFIFISAVIRIFFFELTTQGHHIELDMAMHIILDAFQVVEQSAQRFR